MTRISGLVSGTVTTRVSANAINLFLESAEDKQQINLYGQITFHHVFVSYGDCSKCQFVITHDKVFVYVDGYFCLTACDGSSYPYSMISIPHNTCSSTDGCWNIYSIEKLLQTELFPMVWKASRSEIVEGRLCWDDEWSILWIIQTKKSNLCISSYWNISIGLPQWPLPPHSRSWHDGVRALVVQYPSLSSWVSWRYSMPFQGWLDCGHSHPPCWLWVPLLERWLGLLHFLGSVQHPKNRTLHHFFPERPKSKKRDGTVLTIGWCWKRALGGYAAPILLSESKRILLINTIRENRTAL